MKLWFSLVCSVSAVWAGDASIARIQEAATKAVAIIQKSQKNWYAKQSCFSCHPPAGHSLALAFQSAREHGIPVDEQAAHADAAAAFRFYSNLERAVEYTNIIEPALSDGYGMIAANAAGVRPSLVTAVYYARLIAARQEADGHWGDSRRKGSPESYSPFTATAIALRAVQLYGHPSQKADIEARAARVRNWLVAHQPRTTEERVYQLRGASWAGADRATLQRMAAGLKASQQADGGWSSLDGRSSDAYSTGEVLVALHEAGGVAVTDVTWKRGIDYLLSTQAPDGFLARGIAVASAGAGGALRISGASGSPLYGHDQFISAMGESMAVIALATALGPRESRSRRSSKKRTLRASSRGPKRCCSAAPPM